MGKCMNKSPGGCLVKHGANFITGIKLTGAVCDHCETFVCHGRQVRHYYHTHVRWKSKCSVYQRMAVHAHWLTPYVSNVNEGYGIMAGECLNALFVKDSFAKMISLNIKPNAKFLILKIINVARAIDWVNGVVCRFSLPFIVTLQNV